MILDRPVPAVLALVLLAAAPLSAASLQSRVEEAVRSLRGTMGVAAKDLATGETVFVDADTQFPTASVIKVAVMVEVFHQMAEGRLRRADTITLEDSTKVDGSGVLQRLHGGLVLTIGDLLDLMMTVSDNTATNLLIARVGTANVDQRLVSYGITRTKLFRPTFRDGKPDVFPEEEKEFGLGVATPREMARLMELIAEGKVVDRASSEAMIAIMREQSNRTMIPRSLPETDEVVIADKPGWDSEKHPDAAGVHRHVRGDVAVVTTPRGRYVIAIFARQVQDTRWGPDNEANVLMGRISRMVYDAFGAPRAARPTAERSPAPGPAPRRGRRHRP
jgi:beta-lactamase class A